MFRRRSGFFCAWALVAASAGCGSSVSPELGRDGGLLRDTGVATDGAVIVPPVGECNGPRDCDGMRTPDSTRFGITWSCIGGRCTFASGEPLVCTVDAQGCARCDGQPPVCPGQAACITSLSRGDVRIESSNCARDYFASVRDCAGRVVRLTDGTSCLLTEAPTGAIRYVFTCGTCETVFMPAR